MKGLSGTEQGGTGMSDMIEESHRDMSKKQYAQVRSPRR